MIRFHEDIGHGDEAGVVVHGKGNRNLPWSDEDDWHLGREDLGKRDDQECRRTGWQEKDWR